MNRATPHETSSGTYSGTLPSADPRAVMHNMRDKVSGLADEAGQQAMTFAGEAKQIITRHPYATIAAAAGFAFVVGALWKLNQPRSRFDALWDLLPSRADMMGRHWR
jgi:hypothetical protein